MIEDTSFTFPAGYRSTIPARSSKPFKILVSSISFLTFLTSSSYSWVMGSGKLSIQQTFRFEISEPSTYPMERYIPREQTRSKPPHVCLP